MRIALSDKEANGYVIPLGPVNLVLITTDVGMVGCGAFDIMALDRFDYPAARGRSNRDTPIVTLEDLLEGVVRDANHQAEIRGIQVGMPIRVALGLL